MAEEIKKKNSRENLAKLVLEITEDTVSRDDIKGLLDTFIAFFNKLTKKVDGAVGEMQTATSRIGKEVAAFEKRLRSYTDSKGKETAAELEKQLNELRLDLAYVESKIMTYDDSGLQQQVAKLRESIFNLPQSFDPKDVVERIDALQEEIKSVKLARGGGGVTDLRIRQAFKHILHTEEPVGAINGSNTAYTVNHPIFAVLAFSLNGETIPQLPNYTIANRTITFATALPAAYSGQDFEIKYIG